MTGSLHSDHETSTETPRRVLRIGSRHIRLPESRMLRMGLGILLVIGGILGFLPILGFWMIPLGLLILSHDIPMVRRWRRRLALRFGRRGRKG
ncbi:hypothetical protein [Hoeflea sp.]|uniref:hypothetical protein n=1 Tax=Hoeflea sp. TaxID=1940281 RepID=UPI003B011884